MGQSYQRGLERVLTTHYDAAPVEVPHEISRMEREPESMQERPFTAEGVAKQDASTQTEEMLSEYGTVRHRREVDPEREMEEDTRIRNEFARNIMHNRYGAAEQLQTEFPSAARYYELLDNAPIEVPTYTANPSENIREHPANPHVATAGEPVSWWEWVKGETTQAREAIREANAAVPVSGRSGDINAKTISENSVYQQGLVNEQNQLLKSVLLKMNKNKSLDDLPQHVSFDDWQEIVNNRFKEALELQIDKAIRDEEIMDLSQKNRILERNALFNEMYFTPLVA